MGQLFSYHPDIVERFPTIRAGILHATGLSNNASPPGLLEAYRAEQTKTAQLLETTSIAEVKSVAAWRRVFSRFGAQPTRYRNAAEVLLRRLSKSGNIPTISTLVDIGNLVSIRYAMPVAVFDLAGIDRSIVVRHAEGTEPFTDLGSAEITHPEPGEVVFVDRRAVICARRWCWRQSAQSATGESTTDALFVIEGHHETADSDVESAIHDLVELLEIHQPDASNSVYRLSAQSPTGI